MILFSFLLVYSFCVLFCIDAITDLQNNMHFVLPETYNHYSASTNVVVIRLRCSLPAYHSKPSLICDFCPSDQRFAYSFLQIPPHGRHPCCSAIHFPLPGHVRDLHPLERAHGAQTKERFCNTSAKSFPLILPSASVIKFLHSSHAILPRPRLTARFLYL